MFFFTTLSQRVYMGVLAKEQLTLNKGLLIVGQISIKQLLRRHRIEDLLLEIPGIFVVD